MTIATENATPTEAATGRRHARCPPPGRRPAGAPLLQAENVDLFYGAAQALWGVSLSAEAGKVTALMGRNGVGKTSFLRAVVGEQPIGGGTILFDGKPLGRMAPHDRARLGIGYVPQGRDIFPLLTVKENLETGFAPLKRSERTIPPDVFDLFPVLQSMLAPARRRPVGRPAAAARHRPGAGHPPSPPRPRRADRRHPAVDHQGHRPRHPVAALERRHRDPAGRAVFRLRP